MSIHYVLIARDMKHTLAEYVADAGNYQMAIANLLPKLENNRRKYFQSQTCTVYTYCMDNIQFICLTDNEFKLEAAYSFLEALRQALMQKFTPEKLAETISLSGALDKEIKDLATEYTQNPEGDKAKGIITDLSELKNAVAENLCISLFSHPVR